MTPSEQLAAWRSSHVILPLTEPFGSDYRNATCGRCGLRIHRRGGRKVTGWLHDSAEIKRLVKAASR